MEIPGFTNEEELLALEEGLKSRFWQVVTMHMNHKILTVAGVALGEKTDKRDWQAGRASGLKDAYQMPTERVNTLRALIKQKKIQREGK